MRTQLQSRGANLEISDSPERLSQRRQQPARSLALARQEATGALLNPAAVLKLQRWSGNRAVSRMLARRQATHGRGDEIADDAVAGSERRRSLSRARAPEIQRRPAPAIQRQPDPWARDASAGRRTAGGGSYEVVHDKIRAVEPAGLAEALDLPPGTIPPGAADNPEFVLSLASSSPGGSAFTLEEMLDLPESVAGGLPDGKVVELSQAELNGLPPEPASDSGATGATEATAAVRGADRAAVAHLARYGYASAGPNAIGIVAFPQSRLVRGVTGHGFKGPGPWIPESRILLGHTAVYVRIDGKIQLIRSYAPKSLTEAALHFRDVRSGGGGVPAAILDHTGAKAPAGGRMFDITSGQSIEYPVPKEMAARFAQSLPEGGPLPGDLYTAQPEVAAQLGKTRLCNGRNCVHWAIAEVERSLGSPVGPGGQSIKDYKGVDTGRQGRLQGWLGKGGGDAVKLPGGQTSTPTRGAMSGDVKVLRWGGRVFLVVGVGLSAYRIANAPEDQMGQVIAEEIGGHAGGLAGGAAGVAGCMALGVATGGVGLLLCGIGGGYLGSKIGSTVLAPIGTAIDTLLHLPELLGGAIEVTSELASVLAGLAGGPFRGMGQAIISSREQLDATNWDLRYMPPQLQHDLIALGSAMWAKLGSLEINDYVQEAVKTLGDLGISRDVASRIAASMVAIAKERGQANAVLTGDGILAMKPLDFVRYMRAWRLTYVQDPDYRSGEGGRFENEGALKFHLFPLLQQRATVNPNNWDLVAMPAVNLEDGSDIDLGTEVGKVGSTVWARLAKLDETELPPMLAKILPAFGVPESTFVALAEGIGPLMAGTTGIPLPGELGADTDLFREQTPESFVHFLLTYKKTGFKLKHDPAQVAERGIKWVRAGFQPW